MTLTLTPETETQLAAVAAQRGLPPEAVLSQLVADEARRVAEETEMADAVACLHRGTSEIADGDWVSLEALRSDLEAQAQRRRQSEPIPTLEDSRARR